MHKYSESKNNFDQIDQSKRTRKELETDYVKPLCAALGFHQFAERRKLFTCFICGQLDWSTTRGREAESHFYLCQMPLMEVVISGEIQLCNPGRRAIQCGGEISLFN